VVSSQGFRRLTGSGHRKPGRNHIRLRGGPDRKKKNRLYAYIWTEFGLHEYGRERQNNMIEILSTEEKKSI
jgi:hypothetical protein